MDVIVPVYKGLKETRACIESVLFNPQNTEFELIVIDDSSPEPELAAWLEGMAELGKFTLLRNHSNVGFVQTVNRGMELHRDKDVILLNNDAIVANDWLDRLVNCAYSDARIATVTPFSNNAVICSYPRFCENNELPAGLDVAALDSIVANVNHGDFAEIPTGVGFCLYIRRDAIDEVGLFDAGSFGKGYGEENDFCQRAIKLGWKNVLAANVFVQHLGGVSFAAEQGPRKSRAMEVLTRLHPNYAGDVRKFIAADPIRPFRLAVDLCRLATGKLPVILAISHNRGGGTQKHIDDLGRLLVGKAHCLLLRPVPGKGIELTWNQPGEALNLTFDIEADYGLLLETLNAASVCRAHFHHLAEVPLKLVRIAQDLSVPYDLTIHDYYLVCPRIHFAYASESRYCGEKGEVQCNACLRKSRALSRIDISTWRSRNAKILEGASRVFAPSRDAAKRLKRYFPHIAIATAPHPEPVDVFPIPQKRARLTAETPLRVFVLGALSKIKGADLLEACAIDAAKRNLPLRFELIGFSYRNLITVPAASLLEHGHYDDGELQNLLKHHAPDLIWFPALSPETYSYTLSAALAAKLPVAVPNLGAFAERVTGRPRSWIFDWSMTPAEMNDWLVSLRKECFVGEIEVDAFMEEDAKRAIEFSYPEDYLRPVEIRDPAETVNGVFSALAETICDRQIATVTQAAAEHEGQIAKLTRAVGSLKNWPARRLLINVIRGSLTQIRRHGAFGFARRLPYYLKRYRTYLPALRGNGTPATEGGPFTGVRAPVVQDIRLPPDLAGTVESIGLSVSVMIPTLNAGMEFTWLLRKLKAQKGVRDIEIVIVDSGSTDGTVERARKAGCTIIEILPEEFTHSYARNIGAEAARGDYLLFMVQDAYPIGDYWVNSMLRYVLDHSSSNLAAVSCSEYSRSDSDMMYDSMINTHYRFLGCLEHDRIGEYLGDDHISLRSCGQLSNVSCLIGRELFSRYRYRGDYAEDLDLGIRLIKDGYRVAMLASVKAVHSHNRPAYYYLKRSFVDVMFLSGLFDDFAYPHIEAPHGLIAGIVSTAAHISDYFAKHAEAESYPPLHEDLRGMIGDWRRRFGHLQINEPCQLGDCSLDDYVHALAARHLNPAVPLSADDKREAGRFLDAFLARLESIMTFAASVYRDQDATLRRELCEVIRKTFAATAGSLLGFLCVEYAEAGGRERAMVDAIKAELKAGI